MDFIYQVNAKFDDGESIYHMLVGNFTNSDTAKLYRDKWEDFFNEHKKLLDQPKDWDPNKDEWSKDDFDDPIWCDSKEYYTLLCKLQPIKDFLQVDIDTLNINQEVFIEKSNGINGFFTQMNQLMIQFDRDWKIKKLSTTS